ncbi:MAG TPA: hypothetical protein VGL37_08070 [Solirubrobacteraceae bacterium]
MIINGRPTNGNAISAAPVLYNSTAQMTPFTTIYLWVQSQVQSNSVVTLVTSPMTKVTFGDGVTSISLEYEPQTGTFVPQGGGKLTQGLVLDQLLPSLA